ncbi:MAG: hypothetical protein WB679_18575, partial [Terracidiphilus sp.]
YKNYDEGRIEDFLEPPRFSERQRDLGEVVLKAPMPPVHMHSGSTRRLSDRGSANAPLGQKDFIPKSLTHF